MVPACTTPLPTPPQGPVSKAAVLSLGPALCIATQPSAPILARLFHNSGRPLAGENSLLPCLPTRVPTPLPLSCTLGRDHGTVGTLVVRNGPIEVCSPSAGVHRACCVPPCLPLLPWDATDCAGAAALARSGPALVVPWLRRLGRGEQARRGECDQAGEPKLTAHALQIKLHSCCVAGRRGAQGAEGEGVVADRGLGA